MGNTDFHKNQYETGRGKGEGEKLKEKVTSGLRVVLQNYISREEADTGRGMGKFDALVHDRISLWREYERNLKMRKFTLYYILTFFIVPVMLITGAFGSWLGVVGFSIGVFGVSWLLQYAKTIKIRAYAPTDSKESREGVKKAISDIWFETLLSVRLSYLWALFLLLVWGIVAYYFGDRLGNIITSWVNFIIGFFGKEITYVEPYYFVSLIFIINMSSLLGDYLFWKILYPREKNNDD